MFKLGDKVVVRPDLKEGVYINKKNEGKQSVLWPMLEYAGEIAIIKILSPSGVAHRLDIDGGAWNWSDEMLIKLGEDEDYFDLLVKGKITKKAYDKLTRGEK